ncbi:hypothetical protein [Desulfovibrio ferrophilus]|uniref:Uncharacterized protein n=1 Tax=Desulfovibrio ferrophilus TaxID=241368 RepID=A0A2Z6AYN8_9BACT|nr:hypothetical protein [Desulfovibrio ferrophilus]BBD08303.1 uncharacterized protein DFE_1577 [Desulfovibrio ferrophilus]
MDFQWLFKARDYLTVKKHTPGTLKLGVSPAIMTVPELSKIPRTDVLPKGIKKVDVSIFTMSATIEYDTHVLDHTLVDELFATTDPERGTQIVAELNECLELGLA